MSKKIKLRDWAERNFSPRPSDWVLNQMCRRGEIYPAPIKIGRDWWVHESARHIADSTPANGGLLAQLQA